MVRSEQRDAAEGKAVRLGNGWGRTALVASSLEIWPLPSGWCEERCGVSQGVLWYFTGTTCEAHCLYLALLMGESQRFLGSLMKGMSTQGSEDDDSLPWRSIRLLEIFCANHKKDNNK